MQNEGARDPLTERKQAIRIEVDRHSIEVQIMADYQALFR